VDVAHVRVNVAHELFDAFDGGTISVTELRGDRRLDGFGEDIDRPIDLVMKFVAGAQQVIVGRFELFAFAFADHFPDLKVFQGERPVFEKSHPEQVLVIAQPAAAVLDIGLLHAGGIAVFGAACGLILQPGCIVSIFITANALGQDHPL
jgi:hypothetical protein